MKLRILEILEEKHKTKYWLWMQVGSSYQNFNNMVTNKTKSIRFETLQTLCDVLKCMPNDLFDMENNSLLCAFGRYFVAYAPRAVLRAIRMRAGQDDVFKIRPTPYPLPRRG